jgi:hypothetical protein
MRGAGAFSPKSMKIVRGIMGKDLLKVLITSEQKRLYRISPLVFVLRNSENLSQGCTLASR